MDAQMGAKAIAFETTRRSTGKWKQRRAETSKDTSAMPCTALVPDALLVISRDAT